MMKYCLLLIGLLFGMSVYAQQAPLHYTTNPIASEHIRLAEAYIEQGLTDKAIKQLDECIKSPPATYAYWLRGSSLYNEGKWKKSIKDLQVVVADTVGIPADLRTTAKAILAQAQERKNEQRYKRISHLGIYGTAYAIVSGTVKVGKIIRQTAGDTISQAQQNTAENDSTVTTGAVQSTARQEKK